MGKICYSGHHRAPVYNKNKSSIATTVKPPIDKDHDVQ